MLGEGVEGRGCRTWVGVGLVGALVMMAESGSDWVWPFDCTEVCLSPGAVMVTVEFSVLATVGTGQSLDPPNC